MARLIDSLKPCGPIVDPRAASRVEDLLADAAKVAGWGRLLTQALPSLAPVFGASSYLWSLVRRDPERLRRLLEADPKSSLDALIDRVDVLRDSPIEVAKRRLRDLKGEAHLLIALADLGGVWDLDTVTGALTRFADAALQTAICVAAKVEVDAGRLLELGDNGNGPVPGYFCIAMGKHGAFELNYSSDIDISFFYDPEALMLAHGVEHQAFAVKLTQRIVDLMADRTADGYVFRVDLRLRPDPSSTPPAMPVNAALAYYEDVGQNWERAAYIKARACAGDKPQAEAFLGALVPFVWRRSLDFGAIADIQSIKRQIHIYKVDDRLTAKGMDLKLGRGGIREIEFYAQTQQLILGGRHPNLRSSRTLDGLKALREGGHITARAEQDLHQAYEHLRALEHRIQMLADQQTHKLPESDSERLRVAALMGFGRLGPFDSSVVRTLKAVNHRYGELFPGEEALSSRFGSLVFTGVDDDPETLATLTRMGFSNGARVSQTIRGWHHGHIAATRSPRSRELFTRLVPRLLDAAHATGSPDIAFHRFDAFFSRLNSSTQIQALFLAQPVLFELMVRVMAYAPALAKTLALRPATLDVMLDGSFFDRVETYQTPTNPEAGEVDFEEGMDRVRRLQHEQVFRVGVQVINGTLTPEAAGSAFADLADHCIATLAPLALAEASRVGGKFAGHVAVIALGKCGSREMNSGSDLDLMTLYRADDPQDVSALKGWSQDMFYARFTQRLIAALSIPTAEGALYEVDMQLRPSGTKGPVAVSFSAFERYYATEAETWELMALTRARVVWASDPEFERQAAAAIEVALRRPRNLAQVAQDVRDMRDLMYRERPGTGEWDVKLSPGGLVDIEFAVQYLQLVHAADGGPIRAGTMEALDAIGELGLATAETLAPLTVAWRLEQNLTQLLKLAISDQDDPADQPKPFRQLLARAGGARDFRSLRTRLDRAKAAAHKAYEQIVSN